MQPANIMRGLPQGKGGHVRDAVCAVCARNGAHALSLHHAAPTRADHHAPIALRGGVGAGCCYSDGFRLGHVGAPDKVYDNNKQRPCYPFVCGCRQGFTWYVGDSQGRLLPG